MAHCLAQNGAKVYITGRRLETLKQTAEGYEDAIIPITGDVTKKEDIQSAFNIITSFILKHLLSQKISLMKLKKLKITLIY